MHGDFMNAMQGGELSESTVITSAKNEHLSESDNQIKSALKTVLNRRATLRAIPEEDEV